jgi:hypothetical protein
MEPVSVEADWTALPAAKSIAEPDAPEAEIDVTVGRTEPDTGGRADDPRAVDPGTAAQRPEYAL